MEGRKLYAKGNCDYVAADSQIRSDELYFNLDTGAGTIVNGQVSNGKFLLVGERINKGLQRIHQGGVVGTVLHGGARKGAQVGLGADGEVGRLQGALHGPDGIVRGRGALHRQGVGRQEAACALLGVSGGDFSGGLATRRLDAFKVLAIVSLVGVVLLATIALIVGEPVPRMMTVFWAAAGGLAGALGIAALYKGLSLGNAAGVAPLSAVIGAVLPVAFGSATEGLPRATQFAGIVIAIIGIWLVTRVPDGARGMTRREVLLSVLAGSGFGCFFILIAQVPDGEIFAPLVVARVASLAAGVAVLVARRQSCNVCIHLLRS